jgi:hypothetical protein
MDMADVQLEHTREVKTQWTHVHYVQQATSVQLTPKHQHHAHLAHGNKLWDKPHVNQQVLDISYQNLANPHKQNALSANSKTDTDKPLADHAKPDNTRMYLEQ